MLHHDYFVITKLVETGSEERGTSTIGQETVILGMKLAVILYHTREYIFQKVSTSWKSKHSILNIIVDTQSVGHEGHTL